MNTGWIIGNAGSTGDRKNPARRRNSVFALGSIQDLTIGGSKQVQISPNFAGTITKTLWTCPRKESTNHSMRWEESKNSRARTRFSQDVKNFISKDLVNPRRFVLRRMVGIHHKKLRKGVRSRASWSHKRKSKSVTNKAQDIRNWNEIKSPEGTRREGPPFPFNLSTRTQKSMAKNLP